jgi:PAS domain S-box-containing protein
MLRNIPLKYRMILGGIAAVLIPFLITGIIIYVELSKSLMEMTQDQSIRIARDASSLIEATLMQEIKLASAIAATPTVVKASKSGDYRAVRERLQKIYKRIGKDFFTLFVLDEKGIVRDDVSFPGQIGLDLSGRDYFSVAKEGKSGVAGPFPARGPSTPGDPIIVVYAPIQENNKFYGIVGIPFNSDFLINILSQKKLGKTGFAYLVNSEGLVLSHPAKESILRLFLFDRHGSENIQRLIGEGKTGTAIYSHDGSEKIAGVTTMGLTGWRVVFSQDKTEIMLPVNRLLSVIVISGTLFLIITILIIIVFSGRLSTPVQKMMEMMKQVTQHSTEIILQLGADGRIIFANPALERITGLKPENIIGTKQDLLNTGSIPVDLIWSSLEAGTPWSGRISLKGNGTGLVTLDIMLIPLRNASGAVEGYLEIGRDASKELMFENRLRQSQKLQAIGTLAGGIAHDFNNILSGILGYAELALIGKKHDSETEKYLKEIIKASERAGDLVRQILTFSRQTEVELKPLLPSPVVKEALKLLRASTPARIDIELNINSNSAIMAEPTRIHQVLMNLFTNAVHAIGENSGTIRMELEDFMVDEGFTKTNPDIKEGRHVVLRVSDTGTGMAPEILDHIFEPFFTTKPQGQGTGLGLSVVHGIVRKLNGIITVRSEVGKGTTFDVVIPCTETESPGEDEALFSSRKGTERIALIDDEESITTTMRAILMNLGYTVTAFNNGIEALEVITANPRDFDVVIADHSMPLITGLEITKNLRKAGIGIPVILTSGYLGSTMENEARGAGISEFLTKPVSVSVLTEAIYRVLGKMKTTTVS